MKDGVLNLLHQIHKLLAFVVFIFGATSSAAETTGNSLHEWCFSSDEVFQTLCYVYIEGSIKGQETGATAAGLIYFNLVALDVPQEKFAVMESMSISRLLDYCVPEQVTGEQLLEVVKKYLADFPQLRHEAANHLIYKALHVAFPC